MDLRTVTWHVPQAAAIEWVLRMDWDDDGEVNPRGRRGLMMIDGDERSCVFEKGHWQAGDRRQTEQRRMTKILAHNNS